MNKYIYNDNNIDKIIDSAINYFDDALIDGNFEKCDKEMQKINSSAMLSQIDSAVLVSILGITKSASYKLPHRNELFQNIYNEITNRKGHVYAHHLLEKYK